jgi:hypothetical protein
MSNYHWCQRCEQRADLCRCPADNEFEAMLDEPEAGIIERLRSALPFSFMGGRA